MTFSSVHEKPNYQALVNQLKESNPSNKVCADCPTKETKWASVNIGVFLCVNCASVHRALGTHVSKVKSLTLDEWTQDQYETMLEGNAKKNRFYENYLILYEKPLSTDPFPIRDQFIRSKYLDQKYRKLNHVTNKIEVTGWMTKQGHIRKSWRKRWFILHDNILVYFKTKQTVTWNFLPPPCGKVILDENTIVDFLPDKKNGFVIRSKARALLAFTETPEELCKWILAFRRTIYWLKNK